MVSGFIGGQTEWSEADVPVLGTCHQWRVSIETEISLPAASAEFEAPIGGTVPNIDANVCAVAIDHRLRKWNYRDCKQKSRASKDFSYNADCFQKF